MPRAFQRGSEPPRQREIADPTALGHTHVPTPFGSRDAELPFVHVHVLPFEPNHRAVSKAGLTASTGRLIGLVVRGRFRAPRYARSPIPTITRTGWRDAIEVEAKGRVVRSK